jgi:hypothetical protein
MFNKAKSATVMVALKASVKLLVNEIKLLQAPKLPENLEFRLLVRL